MWGSLLQIRLLGPAHVNKICISFCKALGSWASCHKIFMHIKYRYESYMYRCSLSLLQRPLITYSLFLGHFTLSEDFNYHLYSYKYQISIFNANPSPEKLSLLKKSMWMFHRQECQNLAIILTHSTFINTPLLPSQVKGLFFIEFPKTKLDLYFNPLSPPLFHYFDKTNKSLV